MTAPDSGLFDAESARYDQDARPVTRLADLARGRLGMRAARLALGQAWDTGDDHQGEVWT